MALKRIYKESIIFEKDPPPNKCWMTLIDKKDPYFYEGRILGPEDSGYAGGIFRLDIHFPIDYPFKPPKVLFKTKIYHPNIDSFGHISLQILTDRWGPGLTIKSGI